MLSYLRAPEGKKEVDDLSIQVYSGASQHQSAEITLVRRHICIFLILVFFAFPISSVLTRRKPAPELSTSSWNVEETRPVVDTSTNPPSRSIAKEEDKTAKLSTICGKRNRKQKRCG